MKTIIKKPTKKLDAIKIMREIRDKLSEEIMNMNYEQERAFIDKLINESKIVKK